MELRGKRKFIAFLVTIGMFFFLMGGVILSMTTFDNSTLTGLGIFSGALGGALMAISGAFYAGNAVVHKKSNDS